MNSLYNLIFLHKRDIVFMNFCVIITNVIRADYNNKQEINMKLQFGTILKSLRRERDITQEELAETLGVSCQSVSRWENGVCYPDIELLPVIANAFDVTVDILLGMDEIRSRETINGIFTRALNFERVGDYTQAIAVLREAVRVYPNNYGLLAELSLALSNTSDIDDKHEAIFLSEKVLENCTDEKIRSTVRANMPFLYKTTGQTDKAVLYGKSLPHIWECREVLLCGLASEEKREEAVNNCLNIAHQVLSEIVNGGEISFSLGYKSEESVNIEKLKTVLKEEYLTNKHKFDQKGAVYSGGRPSYPEEIFSYLESNKIINSNSVCADIGAGTGIFTSQLAPCVKSVYAVEPNENMRFVAEQQYGSLGNVISVNATAESTTLSDASLDMITVAQAFHWFDREKFKTECRRILREDGYVVLVWNDRDANSEIIKDNFAVNKEFCPNFKGSSNGIDFGKEGFSDFFCGEFEIIEFENNYVYDIDTFIKRNLSSSYSPKVTDSNYNSYVNAIKAVFNKHCVGGVVNYPYITRCYIGKV